MAELCRKNARLPVGCVIMASGLARRFGSNKLLADFGGRPLLCRALEVTATPALAARVVVTRSAEVKALCDAQAVPCLLHSLPGRAPMATRKPPAVFAAAQVSTGKSVWLLRTD